MIWLILFSIFIFSFLLTIFIFRNLELRRDKIKRRIAEIEHKEWQTPDEGVNRNKHKKAESKVVMLLGNLFGNFKIFRAIEESLQNELKKANILMKPNELLILIVISGTMGSLIGIIIAGRSVERGLWVGLLTWMLPLFWLRVKRNKRKEKLEAQLPGMINMTANSLKAGYSLIQSFELLSREMAAPLSEEIQRMLQEMRFGISTELALNNFNERIESPDLDLIITAMLIQRQVGGNLAVILDTIGETIRERIRIQGELKALTAQGKMSMVIFMVLPIGLAAFLFMTNPEYMMPLLTDPLGWFLLTIAIFGQLIGVVLIRRIIRIEV